MKDRTRGCTILSQNALLRGRLLTNIIQLLLTVETFWIQSGDLGSHGAIYVPKLALLNWIIA